VFFFLPLGTDRPRWRTPYATYVLLAVCVGVFAVQLGSPDALPEGFVLAHPSLGAWFISIFMHAGVMHLAGNMLFLWLFGTIAEDVLGPGLFLLFFFGGDIGASGLDAIMGTLGSAQGLDIPRLGASGAIAGIMGLSAICFLRTRVRVWYLIGFYFTWRTDTTEIGAPAFLGLWVGWEVLQGMLQSALGVAGGTAHWAHVGGFAIGLAGAVVLGLNKRIPRADLVEGRVPAQTSFEALDQAGRLQQVVKESPRDGDAWLALGRDYEIAGRFERAQEAYQKALPVFLGERRMEKAAEAYAGLAEHGVAAGLTAPQQFDLACALEQAGHPRLAYGLFMQMATEHPADDRGETSLIRAGEIARSGLKDNARAAECYRRLLAGYPFGNWRALAQERLRELGLPEKVEASAGTASQLPNTIEGTIKRMRELGADRDGASPAAGGE
jgi:membrane associated rhomboid family serine protease